MARKQKTYEKQAALSAILAVVGNAAALAAFCLLGRNFSFQDRYVTYNPENIWFPILGGVLFVALAASTIGFFVGLHSAGQRRNTRSRLSWTGFFVSAVGITLTVSAVAIFYFTRNPVVPTPTP